MMGVKPLFLAQHLMTVFPEDDLLGSERCLLMTRIWTTLFQAHRMDVTGGMVDMPIPRSVSHL